MFGRGAWEPVQECGFRCTYSAQPKELELVVSEPEPSRVLVETNVDGSSFTRFTLDPADDGESTHLTITTEFTSRNGLLGVVERLIMSMMLRRIYREELVLPAKYASEKIQ